MRQRTTESSVADATASSQVASRVSMGSVYDCRPRCAPTSRTVLPAQRSRRAERRRHWHLPLRVQYIADEAMRFPVLLFDLDGTVVDSGEIILASMRHATRTVLAREIPAEELLAAAGGPRFEQVMHALDPTRGEELLRVNREHNEPLNAELRCC